MNENEFCFVARPLTTLLFHRTVITLSRENKELNDTNASLRKQLVELASKVCTLLYLFHVVLL